MTPTKLLRPLAVAAGLAVAALSAALVPAGAAGAAGAASLVWTIATPATTPPYLAYAAGAYDPSNGTFVMFGGITAGGVMSGATWVWNGHDWTEYSGGPAARDLASIAFDSVLDQFVLFGGQAGQTAQGTLLADTWAWNGASWVQVAGSLPAPTPRDGATLSYDRDGRLVLFGGTGYATPTGTTPVGTGDGVAPAEETLGDTWLWEGSSAGWVQDKIAGPPARSGAVSTYDSQNGTTVLFGGESSPASASGQPKLLDDTWTWNGKQWAQAAPASSPPARFSAMADDYRPLGGPLVTGGYGSSGDLNDAWYWQGAKWVQVLNRGTDPARQGAAGGYDTASGQLVVFGGTSGGGTLDLTSVATLLNSSPPPSSTTTLHTSTATTVATHKPATTTTTTPRHKTTKPPTGTPPTKPARPGTSAVTPVPKLTLDAGRVARGGRISLDGAGFPLGAVVVITMHSDPVTLGTATAGPGGSFTATVAIPATATTGQHTITASASAPASHNMTASATVDVYAPAHGISTRAKTFLLGLALLIPVLTYTGMLLYGMRRPRRSPDTVTDPANARRSPS